jgi:hypothetical protein
MIPSEQDESAGADAGRIEDRTRSRPFGASATAKLPLMATSNALGSISFPSSAPIL